MAQVPDVLVVVTDVLDEEIVKRIGNQLVRVELLFAPETNLKTASYEACNQRVQHLLEFRILFEGAEVGCPVERFWRNRMSIANPHGNVYRLSRSRHPSDIEGCIRRLRRVHAALVDALPNQREQLDANLQSELQRLGGRRSLPQLALKD